MYIQFAICMHAGSHCFNAVGVQTFINIYYMYTYILQSFSTKGVSDLTDALKKGVGHMIYSHSCLGYIIEPAFSSWLRYYLPGGKRCSIAIWYPHSTLDAISSL